MAVFAHQSARRAFLSCFIILAHCRNIDKQPRRCIDPAGINHVQLIGGRSDDIVGVDFKQISALALNIGDIELVFGHVVMFIEEMDGWLGDLDIDVVVPRKDLAPGQSEAWVDRRNGGTNLLVPPPRQQRPVHDPRLDPHVGHS